MFIGAGEVKSLRHIARGGREGKGKRGGGEEGEEGEGIHSKLRRRRSDGRTDGRTEEEEWQKGKQQQPNPRFHSGSVRRLCPSASVHL